MGASAAVNILHRKKLAAAPADQREALRAKLVEDQTRIAGGVNRALEIGVIDDVVEPAETRKRIAEALAPGFLAHTGQLLGLVLLAAGVIDLARRPAPVLEEIPLPVPP